MRWSEGAGRNRGAVGAEVISGKRGFQKLVVGVVLVSI